MKERLLVLAKAYPEFSSKYGYTICTAGITENGEWRRIYPIPFDVYLKAKYSKRHWIEYEIREDDNPDARKESRKIDLDSIKVGGKEDSESIRNMLRDRIISLEKLAVEFKKDRTSLCVIKPRLDGFELRDRIMDKSKSDFIKFQTTLTPTFRPDLFEKLPSYEFRCCKDCAGHKIFCEDIEAVEVYRKMKYKYNDPGECESAVRYKLYDWMKKRELFFIIGTHFVYGTPIIISLIYPEYHGEPLTEFIKLEKSHT